ncbi:unnamed protein product [Clonostachys rhizophaga]|uniref:non-specific serine/threonine protein kinase n=1 Tax=Clonostachys rhizophaga TaxID=160324 RepID=A0A9N9VQU5_9HYPO|nr:unnamed protein product [Clonostachys rhizophaga]
MEDCKVVFWLKPAATSPRAEALLNDSANSEWVDLAADNQLCLKVTVGKTSKIKGRLVSFGRPQEHHDIVLPKEGFSSTEHCFFDVNPTSHAIMLHDVSEKRHTRLFRHLPAEEDTEEDTEEDNYMLSTDELDNSLSIRSCVILPEQRYTLMIRDMEFLLIPVSSPPAAVEDFVATIPEGYKSMAAPPYLPPETNNDKKKPSSSQTSPHLHPAHATIRHQFVKELGFGGEARVKQYLNLQDGNHYAGKIIPLLKNGHEVPDHGQNSDDGHADALKKRVAEEVRALSKMRHDNVIVYNYTQGWDTNHELRIFMPLYETSLRKLLPDSDKRASGDWRFRVDRMIKDVSSALEYIHAKECFHRDIKPDNILVSRQSFCLADFGMARLPTSTGPLPVKPGHTWQYAAPEVLQGKRESYAVDIFSFGVMILECLTDLPPVDMPGTSDTPGPSAAKDIAERTIDAHNEYRGRLKQAWPAAVSMLSKAPSKRPGANRIYEDLLNSGGVPLASNVRPGDSGRELRSHKRRLAPERGIETGNDNTGNEGEVACAPLAEPPAFIPAQDRDPNSMSWTPWTAHMPERPAQWREREARNAKRQRDRQAARRIRRGRGSKK